MSRNRNTRRLAALTVAQECAHGARMRSVFHQRKRDIYADLAAAVANTAALPVEAGAADDRCSQGDESLIWTSS